MAKQTSNKNEELKEFIKEKRPKLSAGSLTTYSGILNTVYKRCFPESDKMNFDKFNDSEVILKHLRSLKPSSRKTILSALVVVTDNKEYRTQMNDDIKVYNTDVGKQQKSEKQEANWVDATQVTNTYNKLKHNAELLYKKKELSTNDLQEIQNYIILALLGGSQIAPRRSLDYTCMKVKDINKEKDNYIEKDEFVFNTYKMAKCYGTQRIKIPKELKAILNKWSKVNKNEYLLFDTNNKQLTSVQLNQRMVKIFGKKVGVNQMRRTYLSTKFAQTINENKDIDATMKAMGSSALSQKNYILQ
jgi:hypothetical protein